MPRKLAFIASISALTGARIWLVETDEDEDPDCCAGRSIAMLPMSYWSPLLSAESLLLATSVSSLLGAYTRSGAATRDQFCFSFGSDCNCPCSNCAFCSCRGWALEKCGRLTFLPGTDPACAWVGSLEAPPAPAVRKPLQRILPRTGFLKAMLQNRGQPQG